MRKVFYITFAMLIFNSIQANAQLVKYVNDKKQEQAEKKRLELERYNNAISSESIDEYREFLELYPKGKHADTIRVYVNEYDLWQRATNTNTIPGYENYLSNSKLKKYKQQADDGIKELQKLIEKESWSKAVSLNTINSYEEYISNSKFHSYQDEAEKAISEIKSQNEWQRIEFSNIKSDFETFEKHFPDSKYSDNAQKRYHELNAVEYFEQNMIEYAYSEFLLAGTPDKFRAVNKEKYLDCVEEYQFARLNTNSSDMELKNFLDNYPASSHYDTVSNMYALYLSQIMTMDSNESQLSNALAYAKDEETKNAVNQRYQTLKAQYEAYQKEQQHQQKLARRALTHNKVMANGGYVLFGIEPLDFAYATKDDYFQYNIGLNVKFGNFHSPVQFEIGAKPGYIFKLMKESSYSYYSYSYKNDEKLKSYFHMPIYAKLKLNLGGPDKYKFYISGQGFYNSIKEKELESDFSVSGGIGVAWRHWDWLIIYYKQNVNSDLIENYKFFGTSLVYYF